MVGVADVAAHRQAEQLAAEVILKPGTDNLFAVEQVFRADKTNHSVDQQRAEFARHGISTDFAGLLIQTVMGIGRQRTALPGFKVHDVVTHSAALQAQGGFLRFGQRGDVKTERAVGAFGATDRLEHQIHRRTGFNAFDGVGHVREHARLGRNFVLGDHLIHQLHQLNGLSDVVSGRVNTDHGIAVTV